jgi:hypothetical protein
MSIYGNRHSRDRPTLTGKAGRCRIMKKESRAVAQRWRRAFLQLTYTRQNRTFEITGLSRCLYLVRGR